MGLCQSPWRIRGRGRSHMQSLLVGPRLGDNVVNRTPVPIVPWMQIEAWQSDCTAGGART